MHTHARARTHTRTRARACTRVDTSTTATASSATNGEEYFPHNRGSGSERDDEQTVTTDDRGGDVRGGARRERTASERSDGLGGFYGTPSTPTRSRVFNKHRVTRPRRRLVFRLSWHHSFAHPVYSVEALDVTRDGIAELVVLTTFGLHVLQEDFSERSVLQRRIRDTIAVMKELLAAESTAAAEEGKATEAKAVEEHANA
jgi:hypothetical protein